MTVHPQKVRYIECFHDVTQQPSLLRNMTHVDWGDHATISMMISMLEKRTCKSNH